VELEHFERDIFSLRQELTSASGGGNRHSNGSASGGSNRHTAGLESELRQIQDRAGQLQRSRAELVRNIHYLRGTYSIWRLYSSEVTIHSLLIPFTSVSIVQYGRA